MAVSAVELIDGEVFLLNGCVSAGKQERFPAAGISGDAAGRLAARRGTIAHGILAAHHEGPADTVAPGEPLRLRFDALVSHDITYVGIIQTAKVSGLSAFPVPYILTNCHNSLCAVGGTINGDDHAFGLSAALRYGGIYVPPHLAVIHSYMREAWAGCGRMILGSDSHTRYGALGTLAVGEGGGELVKQLLSQRYDMVYPKVICVYLEGKPQVWTGPMDIALALAGAVFKSGFAKNAVLEFTGPGIAALSAEYRNGIDVMTTETACWSSIWQTDETIRDYLALHGRGGDYRELKPAAAALYDGMIKIDLDKIKPMIALPFHPSNAYELDELLLNPGDVFRRLEKDAAETFGKPVDLGLLEKIDSRGGIHADQGIIAGCAGGTFDNIMAAADILAPQCPGASGGMIGQAGRETNGPFTGDFELSVYPGSQPVYLELVRNGALSRLAVSGAVVKTAFCGPCFGAGNVPANKSLSIRHTTRNFPNREGSKPNQGQIASVALMDARSVAATALNGGVLCSAENAPGISGATSGYKYHFDDAPYRARVYNGMGRPDEGAALRYGPNIADWPPMEALGENLLVKIVSFITDPVTTTDELIPSGETSSYRSNPHALAEFTLSRKDPAYVGRAKAIRDKTGEVPAELEAIGAELRSLKLRDAALQGVESGEIQIASAIFAVKPGDGSAREQAASCQRVLGGAANFANEYATKRYRSNLVNWGIIPFVIEGKPPFQNGDYIFIPEVKALIRGEKPSVEARIFREAQKFQETQKNPPLTDDKTAKENCGSFILAAPELYPVERELLLAGSLINYNRERANSAGETGGAK
ncbi:MAG: hydratase [Spirochaetaceae bacterium]|jgi:aconitate hydratase|nr:hydratase [Spirochaetaceae bacterium]